MSVIQGCCYKSELHYTVLGSNNDGSSFSKMYSETGQDIAMTEEPKRAEEGEKPRRRRKRVRRLVSKMFLDDDGSMGKMTSRRCLVHVY